MGCRLPIYSTTQKGNGFREENADRRDSLVDEGETNHEDSSTASTLGAAGTTNYLQGLWGPCVKTSCKEGGLVQVETCGYSGHSGHQSMSVTGCIEINGSTN